MDGAIPAFGADSMQRMATRFNLSSAASGVHSLQTGLFEQLLSTPPPPLMDRQSISSSADEAIHAAEPVDHRDRESSTSSATQGSGSDARLDEDDDQDVNDRPEPTAGAAQFADLPAAPIPAPLPADGASDALGESAAVGTAGLDTDAAEGDADGDTAGVDTGDGQSLPRAAAGEHADDGEPGESRLGEMSTEPASNVADRAADIQQDARDDGASEVEPSVSAAQVQAGAREAVSGSDNAIDPASEAAEAPSDGGRSAHAAAVFKAGSAVTEVAAVDIASNAAEVDLGGLDIGEEPLMHDRHPTQAKESAAPAGDGSRASGQPEDPSTRDGKPRDGRREKWFQRDEGYRFAARSESETANSLTGTQANNAADKLAAGVTSAQSGAMAAAMGQGAVNGSPAAESTAASMLPDTLPSIQPASMNAAAIASEPRLLATDNSGSAPQGGDRQSAQGQALEAVETSRGQSSAQRADGKPATSDAQRPDVLTQAERVRLVQRVSRSFARLGPMGGQISLKLHPPQLGALNVQVRMEGRSMTAKLTTESGAARDAILESLPVLRTRLAEQGFEIGSFQVEVADNQSEVTNGSDHSRAGSDQLGGRENRPAGLGTDYRRLAAQQRQRSDRYEVLPSSVVSSGGAAWELPRGVDVEA